MDVAAIMEVLEAIMIVSFGVSWPMNVIKSLKTKSAKGKSLWFLILIDFGYVAGIIGKILGAVSGTKPITYVFAFYILNLVMVTFDMVLYFINKARDKKAEEQSK